MHLSVPLSRVAPAGARSSSVQVEWSAVSAELPLDTAAGSPRGPPASAHLRSEVADISARGARAARVRLRRSARPARRCPRLTMRIAAAPSLRVRLSSAPAASVDASRQPCSFQLRL